jgi:hypothetical protein
MKTSTNMTKQLSQPHTLTRSHEGFFVIDEQNRKVTDFVPYAKVPASISETKPLPPVVLGKKLKP